MRRILAFSLASALSLPATTAIAAGAQAPGATVSGTATNAATQPLANVVVQLRDAAGNLVASSTSSTTGAFTFTAVPAGNFTVEVVNAAGQIIGTSAPISVAAGATITGVTVSTSAALAGAAGGLAAGGAAAAGGGAVAGETAAVIITSAAGAGVAGVTAAVENASPSS